MSEARFNKLRARFIELHTRQQTERERLVGKYGTWCIHVPRGEREKNEALGRRASDVSSKFFDLLDEVSPRDWRTGISYFWVMTKLTWSDATTRGPLSEMPQCAIGFTDSDMKRLMEPVRETSQTC